MIKRYIQKKKIRLISIMGIETGVGNTHLSIMTANYLANVLGIKVALIEYNDSNDFMKIRMETGAVSEKIKAFYYHNMFFYKAGSFSELAKIFAMDYEIIVIDMHYLYDGCIEEFLCSDVRVVTSSVNTWKQRELKKFLYNNKDIAVDAYKCVAFSYNEESLEAVKKNFGCNIIKVPFEPDPLYISPDSIMWLEKLLFS